jgi:hypothetical protein
MFDFQVKRCVCVCVCVCVCAKLCWYESSVPLMDPGKHIPHKAILNFTSQRWRL